MHFIQFSFANTYIYSPNTWLHKVQTTYKLLITFSFLSFIPYLTLTHLAIIISAILIIVPTLKFYENHYYNCYTIFITTTLCLLPYIFDYSNRDIYKKIQIIIPYKIQVFFTEYKPLRKLISIHYKTLFGLEVPSFIIKLGIISMLHCIVIKTLLLTTMYEDIILCICKYIKINNYYMRRTILISSFASQFLEQMTRYLDIMYTSIKLRNIKSMVFIRTLSISYYIITKFLNRVKYDVYQLSSVLYSREFNNGYLEINNMSTYI